MTEISTPNYAVKQVRGPFVELPDHPGHTASEKELVALCNDLRSHGVPLAADLFSGGAGGGMSLGLEDAASESYSESIIIGLPSRLIATTSRVCPWKRIWRIRRRSSESRRY